MDQPKKTSETSNASVEALVKKLEAWGQTLPAEERDLLEYILQRAEGVALSEEPVPVGATKVATLTETIYGATSAEVEPKAAPWVRLGNPWVKSVKPPVMR